MRNILQEQNNLNVSFCKMAMEKPTVKEFSKFPSGMYKGKSHENYFWNSRGAWKAFLTTPCALQKNAKKYRRKQPNKTKPYNLSVAG